MDITKAKKVFELSKDNKKILVTLWEGDKISSCVTEEPPPTSTLEFPPPVTKQYCDICQGDDELCNGFVDYLKEKGYEATEVALGEEVEESLPRFLRRETKVEVEPEVEVKEEPVEGEVKEPAKVVEEVSNEE